ncbi:MAG: FlgD immunoglobulin-like domain containing protein, partial [Nitrososphaera sp.]
ATGYSQYNDDIDAAFAAHGIYEPLSVFISGLSNIQVGVESTWTANASGSGTTSYQWSVRYEGSSTFDNLGIDEEQPLTFFVECTINELKVIATRGSQTAEDLQSVYVNDGSGTFCTGSTEKSNAEELAQLPEKFALHQNHPNPFNPSTEIKYDLPEDGHVTLSIFNMVGQKVRTLVDEPKTVGYHNALWDGRDEAGKEVSSGVYLYRIYMAPNKPNAMPSESLKKMILVR